MNKLLTFSLLIFSFHLLFMHVAFAQADGCCLYRYSYSKGVIDPQYIEDCEYICANSDFCKEYDICPGNPCSPVRVCYAAEDVSCSGTFMIKDTGSGCPATIQFPPFGTGTFDRYLECDEAVGRGNVCQGSGICTVCQCSPACPACVVNENEYALMQYDKYFWETCQAIVDTIQIFDCECE